MTSIDDIIDLLAGIPYTVEKTREEQPDLIEILDLPVIYVGYSTLHAKDPTDVLDSNVYNMHGEDLVQGFDIQIVTTTDDLPTVWKTVYNSLIGKNPTPSEVTRSGLTYNKGGVMGIANGRLWWLDKYNLAFPTLDV